MQVYKYKPYYKYNGPTSAEPFRGELTTEDARRNLELFFESVAGSLGDIIATVCKYEDTLIVSTEVSRKECDDKIKECLNRYDLYAEKVKE